MLDANKLQQAVDQAYTQFHSLNGGQTGSSGYRDQRWQRL